MEWLGEVFDGFLKRFSFRRLFYKSEQYGFRRMYTRNDQYIVISANIHPRDYPAYWNITLGEGSHEWPETDWNTIALWHLKENVLKDVNVSDYSLNNHDTKVVRKQLENARKDLNDFAYGFLIGQMEDFYMVRAKVNESREPYKIYSPDKKGRYVERIDQESLKLKHKYSK